MNPTKEQKEKGEYLPRLSLSNRPKNGIFQTFLRIEFSAPKIIYNNNFQEVCEDDFDKVISDLKYKLFLMKIRLSDEEIRTASVSSIHYCRNITLEPYVSCSMVINQLEKAGNYNEWLDVEKTNFRNGGHILHLHTDRWEFVMYDKLKDLERSKLGKKRAFEKDNYCQLDLFKDSNPIQEVFRLELRINSKQKLSQLLTKIGYGKRLENITFENVFKNDISKKLLHYNWNKIRMVNNLPDNIKIKSGIVEISTAIRSKYPTISDTTLMKLTFGIIFIEEYGVIAFREYMHWDKKRAIKWNRFHKQLEKLSPLCNNVDILREIGNKILLN